MPDVNIDQRELDRLRELDDEQRMYRRWVIWIATAIIVVIVVFIGIIFAWKAITPKLNLYKANTENQKVISQQRAQSDAAVYAAKSTVTQSKAMAEAEIERAKGAAAAQAIIADTLTEPYLRYLYIQGLGTSEHEVIYLPTEAGLPILEAGRFHNEAPVTTTP